jgi:putative MATE family efflux protein
MAIRIVYSNSMSADASTARQAAEYLLWFIPAMALQFALVAMGAALRGVGNFKPTMLVSTVTVIINMILAPFLIFGWVTGRPYGVAGAAISSLIAIIIGVLWMTKYFLPRDSYLRFMVADWKPRLSVWKRMVTIGLPSGFEFVLMAVYIAIVYAIARPFGAAAQAGFGIGGRIVQAGFMPVVALGFSVAPVAGQNVGARQRSRVIDTYKHAAMIATGFMLFFTAVCHIAPVAMVHVFSRDLAVIDVGEEYLRIISLNYFASGLIFVNASMFQAMGNTVPSLITSTVRIIVVAIPALILSRLANFDLTWVWWLSVVSVFVQLGLSSYLLRSEFRKRLSFPAPEPEAPSLPAPAIPA